MLGNWRSPPCPGKKFPEKTVPVTDDTGKWKGDMRVAAGLVVAMKRGNSRGAKEPC
jgi:hypothetical protein